jgi:hypothetical protein
MTARVANIMIGVSWVVSTFVTSLIMGTAHFELGVTHCMLPDIVPAGILIAVVQVLFMSILLAMLYLYMRIFCVAKRQMQQIQALTAMTSAALKTGGMKQELKATKQLAFIVLVFVCCHAMFYFIMVVGYFYEDLGIPGDKYLVYYKLSVLILFFNALMNPIVYALKSKEFKEAFKRILCKSKIPTGQGEHTLGFNDASNSEGLSQNTDKTNRFADKVREHTRNGDLAIVDI